MNKKLVYETYKGCKDIIVIDLHNGYSMVAIKGWNNEKKCYVVELRLKENSIEKWDLIEKAEAIEFNADYKTINREILKHVGTLLSEGFFEYYINRNKYELKCYNKGFEYYEYLGEGKTNV